MTGTPSVSSRAQSEAVDWVDLGLEVTSRAGSALQGSSAQINMLEWEEKGVSKSGVQDDDTHSTSVDIGVGFTPRERGPMRENAVQIDMLEQREESVSNASVQGFVRVQVGLGNSVPSRTLHIEREEEQEHLNWALQQLLDIIHTEDFIDVWVGRNKDGHPCLHTLTVYRKVGDEIEPEHYNLIAQDEWIRLLHENMAARGENFSREAAKQYLVDQRKNVEEITKSLSQALKQVRSHVVERMYSNDSICPIGGEDPFARASLRIGKVLQDPNFVKQSVPKMLLDPNYKMVDSRGQLNARGSRALKEVLGVHYLIEYEKEYISNRLSFLRAHSCSDLIERAERMRISREIKTLMRRSQEIEQYSKVACMIGMIQIHREVRLTTSRAAGDSGVMKKIGPVSVKEALIEADQGGASPDNGFEIEDIYCLNQRNIDAYKKRKTAEGATVKLVKKDGSKKVVSRADFLHIAADKQQALNYRSFSVIECDLLDPVVIRERLSLKIAKEFNDFVIETDRRWYQTDSHERSWLNFRNVQSISTEEKNVGFQLGNILFYKGVTSADAVNPSFRLINQLRHQDRDIPLRREIGGVNSLLPAASELVCRVYGEGERRKTYLDHFSKIAVDRAMKRIQQLGEFEGQLPHQVIRSAFG